MANPVEQERQRLLDIYRQFSAPAQAVVKLLAVNWGALSKSQIVPVLRKAVGTAGAHELDYQNLLKTQVLLPVKDWSGQRLRCNPLIAELVARDLILEGMFNAFVDLAHIAAPLQKTYLREGRDEFYFRNQDELIREVRLGMYWRDEAYIASLYRMLDKHRYAYNDEGNPQPTDPAPIYAMVCANPFDAEWFNGLPLGIRQKALPGTLALLAMDWRSDRLAFGLLREGCKAAFAPQEWRSALALQLAYRGEWATAADAVPQSALQPIDLGIHGLLSMLRGNMDVAVKLLREGLSLLRRESGNKKALYPGPLGLFHILALHLRNASGDMEEAQKLILCAEEGGPLSLAYQMLGHVAFLERNNEALLQQLRSLINESLAIGNLAAWEIWVGMLVLYRYQNAASLAKFLPPLESLRATAQDNSFAWLAAEMAWLIARINPARKDAAEQAAAFAAQAGLPLLLDRIPHEEPWERALKAIANTAPKLKESKDKSTAETRLVWQVYPYLYAPAGYGLEAREQPRNLRGGWNKGKAVSAKRLRENTDEINGMTEQDMRIASHIAIDRHNNTYHLTDKGWLALVGHPHVCWKDSGTPVEVACAEPELRVKKKAKDGHVRIEFWPQLEEEQKVAIHKDGLSRLHIIDIKPEHHRLAAIIGKGLEAPLAAQERIIESLSAVSSLVTIHSDIGGAELTAAETVEADPRPRIQLIPEGEGLRVALLVRPFGEQGAYHAPGAGGAGLIADIGGKRLQTLRDLKQEREQAGEVLALCPSLGGKAEETQEWQWLAADAESSLDVLLELHGLGEAARVEWPQGEKFKMLGQANLNRFSLKLQQQRDWFSVSGELTLDNGEVVNMQRLLELTANSRSKFIRLDENRFLALTDAFRKRLDDLRAYSDQHGKDQRINILALPALEDLAEEVGDFQADAAWRKHIERLREAERFQPKLPSTLQAELRDYQREGFEWLARLAAWGVGACLADDMGLGKTLQAIALILTRAGDGPSLVVAPTSVCFNWHNELTRFAPTLNVRFLNAGDRQQIVESLKPWDLLICSYGLLQQESVGELLAGVKFRTIVLDEAQAIKNPATKRSQQAMALHGEFKLITTGTPVENHLGELWNLMRFANPGLLGSLESFNRRYAGPIERNQDRDAKHRLKKLIQPFILRRTKSQVLDELPPRTEIELQVELSDKEATFYEALRRKLMDELAAGVGPIEDKRFQVLAAITKLRRACCNPQLVAPELGLSSSKLELFGEVLDELLDNHHKALVFSQFVDHLNIIRAHLDGKGISYQYLDGQTPAAERKKRVEAFQSGQGDVFLISLKAGGVGLNLTAADYVIHMDPWWNPAVEDQASDRAHRIGQQRPVTVYRLVTKGTIEEQIVSLHRQKRDLADSLLEGGEISGKIGAEQLLMLMRGE
ncbi:MAG: DEAD/DEAH box helicase [Candidatus Methylumidiphilus sp.]